MPAFNLDDERKRLREPGLSQQAKTDSTRDSVRTYLMERTGAPSYFRLEANPEAVTAVGYEQRGDLDNSYAKSVQEAEKDDIAKRYRLENEGYAEVKKQFFDLPLYSTIMLFSPSPDVPIPGYPGHGMTYFYHILPHAEKKKRVIKALAIKNYFTKDEQAEILTTIGAKAQVSPTEEGILRTPVAAYSGTEDAGSMGMLWEKVDEVYSRRPREADFPRPSFNVLKRYMLHGKELWDKKHQALSLMTEDMAKRIIRGESDENLAKDWDIMLNLADKELLHEDVSPALPGEDMVLRVIPDRETVIFDRYRHLSFAPRRMPTPCGLSAGLGTYSTQASDPTMITGTFVVKGELSGGERALKCKNCPLCLAPDIMATIKNGEITCPKCKKSAPYQC